jgi:hypothetical protein
MTETKKYTKYIEWAILLIAFFGLMTLPDHLDFIDGLKPESGTEKAIFIVSIIVMAIVVLAVHELGHLLAGLAQGFKFFLYVVGPLGFKRDDNDKVTIYLNKNLAYYGGVAGTTPVEDHPDNAKKFARILLAGPVASLLFAAICIVLAYLMGRPLGMTLFTGGMISIAIFFATTIPSRTGMMFTDRKRYQRLVTPGKDQQVELAMLRIMGQFSKDNSYQNINPADIAIMASDDAPFISFFGHFNKVCHEIELHGEVSEATQAAYDEAATAMPAASVKAFSSEIEKYRDKVALRG